MELESWQEEEGLKLAHHAACLLDTTPALALGTAGLPQSPSSLEQLHSQLPTPKVR